MKKTRFVRSILTGALLYGVYGETGIWTTISLFLVFAGMELMSIQRELK